MPHHRLQGMFKFLSVSLLLHSILFFQVNTKSRVNIQKKYKTINLVIGQETKKSKVLKRTKIFNRSKVTLAMLGVTSEEMNFSHHKVDTAKSISFSKSTYIFDTIDDCLDYPSELADNLIQGNASAKFYLTKDGKYDETRTQVESHSAYLRVHIARLLRTSLSTLDPKKLNLKKTTQFTVLFLFKLTTDQNKKHTSKLFEGHYFYYRQKYGVSTATDSVVKGVHKTLTHLTNWLTLLEYLPDNDKVKAQKNYKLKSYEDDPFFYL